MVGWKSGRCFDDGAALLIVGADASADADAFVKARNGDIAGADPRKGQATVLWMRQTPDYQIL